MLRLANLPWTMTRNELSRYISRMLDTRVRYSKVLYDKETGLSRGVAVVQLESDQLSRDILRRGSLTIEGRNVVVAKENSRLINNNGRLQLQA